MRRRILMVLLALGAFGGFAAGFASLRCRAHGPHGWHSRRAAFEQRVAQTCVDAALRARPAEAPR
jgi:hypothetical protein